MPEFWFQTILLLPAFIFNGWLSIWLYKKRQKRKEMKFLKKLMIHYPEGTSITFVSVETSDKAALDDIMDQWGIHLAKEA